MNTLLLKSIICVIAMAFACGVAIAQPVPTQADAGTRKELLTAQAEFERAARRVAELSRAGGYPNVRANIDNHITGKPIVGVVLAPDAQAGVRIAGVTPEGPAAKSGLRSGDRLVSINGTSIIGQEPRQRLKSAHRMLRHLDTKTAVALGYSRDGSNTVVSVMPKLDQRWVFWNGGGGDIGSQDFAQALSTAIAPQIREELIGLASSGTCKGENCRRLTEAFRWSGLNLAAVDPQLGRYFGTSRGVLVLSVGADLAALQAGDVIQKIDDKVVSNPREAMAALSARPANSKVTVDYLRDRKTATAQVKVPKAMPFRVPPPPAPPAAPRPPTPPRGVRTLPKAPDAPRIVENRRIVMVNAAGQTHTWDYDGDDAITPPPPPQPPVAPMLPVPTDVN